MAEVHAVAMPVAGPAIDPLVPARADADDEEERGQPPTPALNPVGFGGPGVGTAGQNGGSGTGGAAPGSTKDYMPSAGDLEQLMGNKSIAAFLAYVGVKVETMTGILAELDLEINDYYSVAAMIAPHELEATITKVAEKTPIPMGQRLKLRSGFLIMREAAGIPTASLPMAPSATPQPTQAPTVMATSSQLVSASLKPGEVSGGGLIPLNKTVDQASDLEVKLLDAKTLKECRDRYYQIDEQPPPADENPTDEQLTSFWAVIFTLGLFYADFAVWLPHWARFDRKRRFTAEIINEHGQRITVELTGPGSFELWVASWNVFRTVILMLGAVANGKLRRYKNKIRALWLKYGPRCWGIIYQADVRMRSERFPVLKERLLRKHDRMKKMLGYDPIIDPARPWDAVMEEALENDEKWWVDHVVDPCREITYGKKDPKEFMDGDVKIGGGASHTSVGSETLTPLPNVLIDPSYAVVQKRVLPTAGQHEPPPRRFKQPAVTNTSPLSFTTTDLSWHDGEKWVTAKSGKSFCPGFQRGTCTSVCRDGITCGVDNNCVHQCDHCRKTGHGSDGCWEKQGGWKKAAGSGVITKGKVKGGKDKGAGKGGKTGKQGKNKDKLPWMKW